MRRKNTIRIAILAVILSGVFLVLRSAASSGEVSSQNHEDQCCKKKTTPRIEKTTWEHLSRQFFSSI